LTTREPPPTPPPRHRIWASSVALYGRGILLRGPSGSGKSDLALRLIDTGAALIADDYTEIAADSGHILASPPPALAGLLEIRGVGIIRLPCQQNVPVAVIVDLVDEEGVERMPEPMRESLLGVELPVFRLAPFPASAAAKVRCALDLTVGRIVRAP
jgi:serine kinase of HPr protein (carbohydrate metabolism regulator)